ncbi:uncharacterized protein LOC141799020 isoform X2 [Halichoeres trimaculatus]|uniref:uncharacterized protein LOC141799020 isoform X2 n=1 Tax=Halichoeres trimaculatus TaxID=147232 RepID=UPI003D9E68CE
MDIQVAVNVAPHGKPNGNELLAWLNTTLQTDFSNVEQVCAGAAFCQLMDWCFPGSLDLAQVRFLSENDEDSHANYSILQAAFKKVGVLRFIPVETLVEKNSVVGLAFLHWFRMFFDRNRKGKEYHPLEARGGLRMHPARPDPAASETPHLSPEINVEMTDDVEEAQSGEMKEKEEMPGSDGVIDLISDEEDDVIVVTEEPQTEKPVETSANKENAAGAAVDGKQSVYNQETLLRFIRRHCRDINSVTDSDLALLSQTWSTDLIQACRQTPYCLYLFMGVDLGEELTTSVVLVGYFDRNSEASVVRPLLTLQTSMDTGAAIAVRTAAADARLLVERLKTTGLRSANLAMFYCNASNQILCQALVSLLQAINPKCLSLCGLPEIAERACNAALTTSFDQVVPLIKNIHRHYATRAGPNQNLKHLFAGVGCHSLSQPLSAQFVFITRTVQRMVETWRGLVDYFKSVKQGRDVLGIRTQLMDHKVKLHFLFLAFALEPLRVLQEFQQQDSMDVAAQLKMVSMLISSYASNLLVLSAKESFISCRDPQILLDQNNTLPLSKLNIGPVATDFLWATAVVDLGEQERATFLDNASTFYKAALQSLAESIPEQLGDGVLRNISLMLKHPEDPKLSVPRPVVSELGDRLSSCVLGTDENNQLVRDYFSVIKTAQEEQERGWRGGQSWPKLLRGVRQDCALYRFILSLLALPSSLQRNKVFAQIRAEVEKTADKTETPKASPESSGAARKRVRRRFSQSGHNHEKDDETSSEEEKSQIRAALQMPPRRMEVMEESDYTDNSSDVVDVTEDLKLQSAGRVIDAECPSPASPAETVYVVGEDDKKVSKKDSSDSTHVPGELVWAVVDGFAAWPAIISSKDKQSPGKRTVWWYGQSMSSQVSVKDLKPFAAFSKHFCPNSFAVLVTYREAIFTSLQEAALRCQQQFSVDLMDREEQLKQMLDWAFGGFLPSGPDGFKPPGAQNGTKNNTTPKPQAKKKLFLKAKPSSPMSSLTSDSSKPRYEEEFDSAGKAPRGVVKSRGGLDAEMRRQGRGRGRGGKVQQKKATLFDEFNADMSPDFVPSKRRMLTKYYRTDQTTSKYTQPDQKHRDKTIREIMALNLDIEEYCLCCATKEVEISHPLFKGSLCTKCKNNLTETLYRYDEDGYQSYCTICCYGLEVILCGNNSCSRSYCEDCLDILIAPRTFNALKEKDPWICYLCQPHQPHGALVPREDWSIRVQELFANNSGMEFEPHRVYPSIPANLRQPIRVLSLFDGIATGYQVLKELGFKVEKYVASEVCEESLAVAAVNHDGKIIHVGDARHITEQQLQQWGPFDLLIGGSPCNDLSIVNPYRKGLYEGTGRLFFEFYRILQLLKPREEDPRPFFWLFENVVFMNTHDKVNICRFLECNPVLVDAVNVSPAHRARCFWGNIPGMSRPIIASQSDKLTLQECLEIGREARVTKVRTITTNRNSLKQGKDVSLLPVLYNGREDGLWITELEKIFGFPKHYTDVKDMNRQQRQKVLGKAWSVPVIRHLFAPLKDYFTCEELRPLTNSNSSPSPSSPCSPCSPELQMR